MPIIQMEEYARRRAALLKSMGPSAIAIVSTGPECTRSGDTEYPYRPDSDFYYLTGFTEPEAIAVLIPNREEGEFILFNRPKDAAQETWTGRRVGQIKACESYGANESYPIAEFSKKLPELLLGKERLYYCMGRYVTLEEEILSVIKKLSNKTRMGVVVPREFLNLENLLDQARLIKSPAEIATMQKAADISAQAHKRAMQACKPKLYEYELEAELQYIFYKNGSRAPAYNCIVGSGENTCILHYNENNTLLKDGELVLIDAGCEYEYYASDITRTFPVNGRFNPEQKQIYEIVLNAQLAGIKEAKPGSTLEKIHNACLKVLVQGLIDVNLLSGKVDELIEKKAYFPFYMHRTSHWLGLDTHDVGVYKQGDEWISLQPGMVLTIEPGLYINANILGVDKKWWNIGVRIEDDILITEEGCKVLSADAPKTIDEIERTMRSDGRSL